MVNQRLGNCYLRRVHGDQRYASTVNGVNYRVQTSSSGLGSAVTRYKRTTTILHVGATVPNDARATPLYTGTLEQHTAWTRTLQKFYRWIGHRTLCSLLCATTYMASVADYAICNPSQYDIDIPITIHS